MTMRTLTLLIALATLTTEVLAQGRTIYANDGRVIGRQQTDSQGTVTTYDASGRAITRESPTSSAFTLYDAETGRAVGKITPEKRR